MKKYLLILITLFSLNSYAQKNDYVERIRLVEKFGKEKNLKLGQLSNGKLAEVMRFAGGLAATPAQAGIIQTAVGNLDSSIQSVAPGTYKLSDIPAGIAAKMDSKSQQLLVKLINSNSSDPSPQNFLASQIAKDLGIPFITSELFKELQEQAVRPSRPVSPTSLSLKRIFSRTNTVQKIRLPKMAGMSDYLDNAYMSLNYSYTEYDDETIGTSGQFHDWSLALHGTILENTDLSFGLVANEGEANGSIANDFRSETVGFDTMIHHKFNDNYGLGVFGFYQHTKFEKIDTKDYGAGYGFLFSTWHDLGIVEVSTVNSWTKAYFEAGNDTLYIGSIEVTRFWTDRFSTSLRAAYTDSLDNDVSGDNSYWTLGGSLGYLITDNLHISLGFNTDVAIIDYESRTYNVGISYYF